MDEQSSLDQLLRNQRGLAGRVQLLELGVSREALRWRLGRSWRAVLPGVVATFTGGLDPGQRLIAAQLYAGPSAYLASWTAAAWYGVDSARRLPVVRLMVPARLSARSSGSVKVTRTSPPDLLVSERGPLRIGARARAVVDAAREMVAAREATALVIEAVQRRIVTVEGLRHELECGPRGGSAQVRRAVDAAEVGAWSVPEADLLQLLSESRVLPTPWANPWLTAADGERLPTPDAWLDDVGLAIQLHSRTYHARDADWEATVTGDGLLGEHGVLVVGVTPAGLAADPAAVRRRVERAYLALQNRQRPHVIATPRSELRWSA